MVTINCKCTSVQIQFYTNNDLFRLQCCCHDCTSALWYASKRGGPAHPPFQCVDTSWFPNDFKVVSGADRIGAFLNFPDADTTRFYCKECWTILLADHAAYDKRLVVVQAINFTEFDGLSNADLMQPQARHFVGDLSAEQLATLPAWPWDPANVYSSVADVLMERFPALQAAGAEGALMNAQILLAKIGGSFVPSGEARLTEGPPTLMQRMLDEAQAPD
ncbi:MAG: hypothetical protein ACI915_004235 [Gammaproteobacteria bacterium]|jgi:hypothetical protein